jgi:ABC-type bacteriocin/lantibiotic exporter with double-glycine peptidase domain
VEKNKFSREMGLIYISGIFSLLISFWVQLFYDVIFNYNYSLLKIIILIIFSIGILKIFIYLKNILKNPDILEEK